MGTSGILFAALAAVPMLAGLVAPAVAGTKFQTNIVPSSAVSPPTNPTLSTAGKVQLDDKGKIQVGVKGVTDGAGSPVTTSPQSRTASRRPELRWPTARPTSP